MTKSGVAAIIHALTALKKTGFNQYGRITVLINGDEEIFTGSPARAADSAGQRARCGARACGTSVANDRLSLANQWHRGGNTHGHRPGVASPAARRIWCQRAI